MSTKPSFIVCEDQPKIDERIVIVLNQATDETFEVIIKGDESGKVVYENLPDEVACYLVNYSN